MYEPFCDDGSVDDDYFLDSLHFLISSVLLHEGEGFLILSVISAASLSVFGSSLLFLFSSSVIFWTMACLITSLQFRWERSFIFRRVSSSSLTLTTLMLIMCVILVCI